MFRPKLALVLMAVIVALGAVAAPVEAKRKPKGPQATSYTLPGTAVFPEGIAFQRSTGDFFVSSTTDGTILRGNVRDSAADVFLPGGEDGRTTAVGLKVDDGRLFIAGGATGKVFVYDIASRELLASFDNDLTPTFVNDVAVTQDGTAYFTDSQSPFLYRVMENQAGEFTFERFIDFTGTALVYQPGFNVNGITASADGRYLIVVQSNTGKLFRIDIASKQVTEIDLGGATVTNGDGILLQGRRLFVVRNRNEMIVTVRLSGDLTQGTVVDEFTDPSFAFPTTIALARGRLLVVNSQFDRRGPGLTPDLPFTVSSVKVRKD